MRSRSSVCGSTMSSVRGCRLKGSMLSFSKCCTIVDLCGHRERVLSFGAMDRSMGIIRSKLPKSFAGAGMTGGIYRGTSW